MFSNYHLIRLFFYRFFASIFHFVAEIYSNVMKKLRKDIAKNCEILKILHRFHSIPQDVTRVNVSFLWLYERFTRSDEMLDPHWILYALDSTHVYFCKMHHPVQRYHAKEAPFLYQTQTDNTTKLARMRHEEFYRFASNVGTPSGSVVYFCNAGRSGSTLLAQMLQVSTNLVLAEPDFFTLLPILNLYERKLDQKTYEKLLVSSFNVLCKNQSPEELYILKTRCNGTRLLGDVLRLMPNVQTMFLWRRTGSKCIQSFARMLVSVYGSDMYVPLLNISPTLAHWLVGFSKYEGDIIERVKPKDSIELAYLSYAIPYAEYYCNKEKADIIYAEFEELIGSPEETIKRIFSKLGISHEFVPEAVDCLKRDSQIGTSLSRNKQANVGVILSELSDERKRRFKEIDQIIGLEKVKFWH